MFDDVKQLPVKKPLRFETTFSELAAALELFQCSCPDGKHAPCEGRITKLTEEYTFTMTDAIHSAFNEWASQLRCTALAANVLTYAANDDEEQEVESSKDHAERAERAG